MAARPRPRHHHDDRHSLKDEDQEEEDLVYDQTPVRVNCPHCGLNIITFIEHESSWVTYAVSIVLLFVLNWAALCVVPVVYPLFKDVVHHCPRCLSVLATRSRVSLPSLRDDVMSFRFGTCVIVLARKYVLVLACLLLVIGGVHSVRGSGVSHSAIDEVVRGPPLSTGWEDFTRDCGFKSYLGNPIHVTVAFNDNYKNKTISWHGAIHHVEPGLSFLWFNQRGAIFVQMDPPQFPTKRDAADLVLLYDDNAKGNDVAKFKRGASISFEATMVEVGRRGAPHVLMMWDVQPGPPLPPKKDGMVAQLGAAFSSAMNRQAPKDGAGGGAPPREEEPAKEPAEDAKAAPAGGDAPPAGESKAASAGGAAPAGEAASVVEAASGVAEAGGAASQDGAAEPELRP